MFLPPVTQDLWPVLKARIDTATMTTILGGPGRLFLEAEYTKPPATETTAWKRGVIVPVLPVGGIRFEPGLPTTLRWLFRFDANDVVAEGLPSAVWASRSGELAQREAARRWQNWDGAADLTSTQIMFAGPPRLDEGWQPRVIYDERRTGTVSISSSWLVDVASASD